MNRREFLGIVGVGAFHRLNISKFNAALRMGSPGVASKSRAKESKAFGSGHFGEWIEDQFGLPAYRYTCNQIADLKALSRSTNMGVLQPTTRTRWVMIVWLRPCRTTDMSRYGR